MFIVWGALRLKKVLRIGFECRKCELSREIDIVIPTISKDFDTLSLLIESLKYLEHKVNNVYIVSPQNEKILKFCHDRGVVFIDELDVLGFGKDYIEYNVNSLDRSGWLFQQLLKLSGEHFTSLEDYLVIDSDTIFVNNNCFIEGKKYIFLASEEWHQPYFDSFEDMFGYNAPTKLSLTSHMMIFNHNKLKKMKAELEKKHNKNWFDIYISTVSPEEQSCISDYDTYANWMLYNYSDEVEILPFYNKSISRKYLGSLSDLTEKFINLKSISFHSYIGS
ncbi:hypothetical protein HOK00_10915 [bacterium]|nr:hypothetical protein [bacterium]